MTAFTARGITKTYGGVTALAGADVAVVAGPSAGLAVVGAGRGGGQEQVRNRGARLCRADV